MDNSQNNIGLFPKMPICDKHSSVDLNSDYTLPDYQPEIRRLLSTKVIILPHGEYIGNGSVEINGEVNYKILYLAADGELYCTTLSDKYGCNAPLDFNSHSVNNDEMTIIPSFKVEGVSTRVLGPRKLNVRTKLDCKISAFSPALYSPNLVGAHNKSAIESKINHTDCINIKKTLSESLTLSDFLSFDTQADNIRIVDFSSTVAFNECISSVDRITVKGDAIFKILYCNDQESPHPISLIRRIPFSHELPCQGVDSRFECISHGACFDEKCDFKENGIELECTLCLYATAQKNDTVSYVADAYSTEKACETATTTISIPNALLCTHGFLTQNDVFTLDDVKLSRDAKIIDVFARCNINELTNDNGKLVLKGTNDYQLIYFLDGEYASIPLASPVKYELECRSAAKSECILCWQASAVSSSARARHDGERLFVDCELNLTLAIKGEEQISILDEMIFSEYLDKANGEMLLCYPERGATVWSVAKHYGESQKSIRAKNSIPEAEEQIKNRFLVI